MSNINPERKNLGKVGFGIDFGCTSIKYGIIDQNRKNVYKETLSIVKKADSEEIFNQLCQAIDNGLNYISLNKLELSCIGIGQPFFLSGVDCIIVEPANLPQMKGFPLKSRLKEKYEIPMHIDMDTNYAALGEYYLGSGKGSKRFLCLVIGTGISCGIIIEDNILRFSFNGTGNTGHTIVHYPGRRCTCGGRGCLEAYTSGWAIREIGLEKINSSRSKGLLDIYKGKRDLDAKDVYDLSLKGDPVAEGIIKKAGECLGIALVNLIHIFNPQIISIGGSIGLYAHNLVEIAKKRVFELASPTFIEGLKIVRAFLGTEAGFYGAALYSLNN